MIELNGLTSQAMQEIIDGTLTIEYLSVAQIIDRYGELLTEKELNQLKSHLDGD